MFRQNPWHTGTPATLTLGSGERLANGNFRFQIHGVAGMVCQVNASHNLISWITIPTAQATVTLTGGTDTFTDLEQNPGFAYRFYRVRSGPILSLNSLGYVAVDVPSGSSMIANQLNNPAGNTVAVLLPTAPVGTTLYKWNETSQQYYPANTFAVGWSDPNMTLNPGEGVLVQAGAATTFTFVGDVPQGTLANPLPASLSIRSAMVPQTGPIDSLLGYPNVVGDVINRYNNAAGAYESYTCLGSSWSPLLAPRVGESFWINTGTARTWTRTFRVW